MFLPKLFFKSEIRFFLIILLFSTSLINAQVKKDDKLLEDKAKKIISQMTLKEKVGMIVGDGRYLINAQNEKINDVFIANRNAKMVIPRLNIRTTALTDGPAGINKGTPPEGAKDYTWTTAFPTGTLLAATWNTDLIEQIGRAFGNEVLEYDYDLLLGPGLNIHRNPKCGRNFEYYSEDPLLSGKMASSLVKGLQSNGVGATLKHFAANNQETNRRTYNAVISQRALREIYLRGFEIAVKESHPWAIMTAYNRLNGFYTPENKDLIQYVVRNEWKYKGLFMTDFDMNYGDAVAQVRNGISMIMSGHKDEMEQIMAAVKDKVLDESALDKVLVYNIKLKLQSPSMKKHNPSLKPDLETHARLARKAAAEGIVLLKNENNTLPLKKKRKIALFGKISYHLIASGTGSGGVRSVKYEMSVSEGLKAAGYKIEKELEKNYTDFIEKTKRENLVPPYFDNPKMRKDNGIKGNQAPPHFKQRLIAFSKEQPVERSVIKKYASKSDLAIITLGRSGGENYENGYLPISQTEKDLVKNVSEIFHARGKKLIVILNIGGVWETASWRDYADAVLLMWHPGQEGGNAVADILSGNVNPSGKLPDTFPVRYNDVPSSKSFPGVPVENPVNSFYEEGVYVGYRFYDSFNIPVAYEFGYGLSYTTFTYSDLKLSSKIFKTYLKVSVTVKNTGKVAGKEVVQLYLHAPSNEIDKPEKELKGFVKTKLLKPGESQKITFTLHARSLSSFWSGISSWVAEKGQYEIRIGASSKDIRLKKPFEVPEKIVVEKVNDVLYPNFMMNELRNSKNNP